MSGPRMKNGSYYSKRKSKKGGLNKLEQKQTREIAKKAIMKVADSKYFNCASIDALCNDGVDTTNVGQQLQRSGTFTDTNYRVMVKGYCTTNTVVGDDITDKYNYGNNGTIPSTMENLDLARRYNSGHNFRMDDQYCVPSLSTLALSITRHYSHPTIGTSATFEAQSPIRFRIIHAIPRTSNGMNQAYTEQSRPEDDLFVNETGSPIGITSKLSIYDIQFFKTNGRRYKIKMDKQFTLNSPNSFNSGDGSAGLGGFQQLGGSKFQEMLNFKFELGKKLFYLNDLDELPTTGATNEFILIHAWYPNLRNQDNSEFAMTPVLLGGKAISTFKDL